VSGPDPKPDPRLDPPLELERLVGGRGRRILAALLGFGALAAAIGALAWNRETLVDSLDALKSASPRPMLELAAGSLAQLATSGLVFWWLYRLRAPVPLRDMAALVAAANAANFLPLRPGLVGRVAYLRIRHGVPLAISVRVTFEAAALTVLVTLFLVLFLAFGTRTGLPGAAGLLAFALSAALACHSPIFRPYAIASIGRLVEVGLLSWRYALAFSLIGLEIDADAAIAFACIASAASMIPLVPNGMGVREWAIGLLAPVIAGHTLEQGIAAELVNRAAELVVTVPAGGLAAAWLARRPRPLSPS